MIETLPSAQALYEHFSTYQKSLSKICRERDIVLFNQGVGEEYSHSYYLQNYSPFVSVGEHVSNPLAVCNVRTNFLVKIGDSWARIFGAGCSSTSLTHVEWLEPEKMEVLEGTEEVSEIKGKNGEYLQIHTDFASLGVENGDN